MRKEIRKKLIEVKEKKESLIIERKLAKSRLLMILGDVNSMEKFHSLPENRKVRMSFQVMSELAYQQQNGIITEQFSLVDILKGLFGPLFTGAAETIAEPFFNSIFNAIGFKSEGFLKKFMISLLTSKPSELISAFSDCKTMTKLLVQSFIEAVVMLIQQQTNTGGYMYDFVRNTLGNAIKDTDIVSGFQDKINDKVCELFNKFSGNANEVVEKLKKQTSDAGGAVANKSAGIFDFMKGL
jgi:hypothetical protein